MAEVVGVATGMKKVVDSYAAVLMDYETRDSKPGYLDPPTLQFCDEITLVPSSRR